MTTQTPAKSILAIEKNGSYKTITIFENATVVQMMKLDLDYGKANLLIDNGDLQRVEKDSLIAYPYNDPIRMALDEKSVHYVEAIQHLGKLISKMSVGAEVERDAIVYDNLDILKRKATTAGCSSIFAYYPNGASFLIDLVNNKTIPMKTEND